MQILIFISLLLGGCAVYKLRPELDHHFSQHGLSRAKESQFILKNPDSRYQHILNKPELKKSFKGAGESKFEVVEIISNEHGFQCQHAFLEIISLGIIPVFCDREYSLVVDYFSSRNALPDRRELSFTMTIVAGWVSLFLAPLQEWEFNSKEIERGIYTIINNNAKSETLK